MKKIISTFLTTLLLISTIGVSANAAETDKLGKKAILVVSFGTSYNDTRQKTIDAIENDIKNAYPDYEIIRAFTSQTIINKLKERDSLVIYNVKEAMEKLIKDGFDTVICQPTHIMNGYEYDDMVSEVSEYKSKFKFLAFGTPLLTSTKDYKAVANILSNEIPELQINEALVFMGHGTEHYANSAYAALDYHLKDNGNKNIFVGTVEGYPDLDTILKQMKSFNPKKIYLMPLMVVAGDHATNDMAGDEQDSWKITFKKQGYEVEVILKGLGEIQAIRQIYINHVKDAIDSID